MISATRYCDVILHLDCITWESPDQNIRVMAEYGSNITGTGTRTSTDSFNAVKATANHNITGITLIEFVIINWKKLIMDTNCSRRRMSMWQHMF